MVDIVYRIYHCPPFTKYYITMLLVSSFMINCMKGIPIFWYFAFSIKKITKEFELWRIFTNFLIGGKFDIGYIIMIYSLFSALSELELQSIQNKAKAKFFCQILYLIILIIGISFFDKFILKITESRSLIRELSYAFYALNAYKDPESKGVSFYMIPIKNKYSPIVLFCAAISSGNPATPVIVGYIAGYTYALLGEYMEEKFGFSFFYVPKFLKRYFRDRQKIEIQPKEENKEEGEPIINMNIEETSNVALRKKESVVEGNEFKNKKISSDEIKWD